MQQLDGRIFRFAMQLITLLLFTMYSSFPIVAAKSSLAFIEDATVPLDCTQTVDNITADDLVYLFPHVRNVILDTFKVSMFMVSPYICIFVLVQYCMTQLNEVYRYISYRGMKARPWIVVNNTWSLLLPFWIQRGVLLVLLITVPFLILPLSCFSSGDTNKPFIITYFSFWLLYIRYYYVLIPDVHGKTIANNNKNIETKLNSLKVTFNKPLKDINQLAVFSKAPSRLDSLSCNPKQFLKRQRSTSNIPFWFKLKYYDLRKDKGSVKFPNYRISTKKMENYLRYISILIAVIYECLLFLIMGNEILFSFGVESCIWYYVPKCLIITCSIVILGRNNVISFHLKKFKKRKINTVINKMLRLRGGAGGAADTDSDDSDSDYVPPSSDDDSDGDDGCCGTREAQDKYNKKRMRAVEDLGELFDYIPLGYNTTCWSMDVRYPWNYTIDMNKSKRTEIWNSVKAKVKTKRTNSRETAQQMSDESTDDFHVYSWGMHFFF